MKKTISVLAITLLMVSTMSVTAFAHGGRHHSGGSGNYYSQYPVCNVSGCTQTGTHLHDGDYYRCQNYSTGHCWR